VNNTNLVGQTTVEDVLEGHRMIKELSQKLDIPIAFVSGFREIADEVRKIENTEVCTGRSDKITMGLMEDCNEQDKITGFSFRRRYNQDKHCNSTNWVTNVVYAINEDWIEVDIGLEKDYIDNIIMIGDTMRCKYSTDEYEFMLIGWVTK